MNEVTVYLREEAIKGVERRMNGAFLILRLKWTSLFLKEPLEFPFSVEGTFLLLVVIEFSVGVTIIIFIKYCRQRALKKNTLEVIKNLRGGDEKGAIKLLKELVKRYLGNNIQMQTLLDMCVKPDKVYEVINKELRERILAQLKSRKVFLICTPVVLKGLALLMDSGGIYVEPNIVEVSKLWTSILYRNGDQALIVVLGASSLVVAIPALMGLNAVAAPLTIIATLKTAAATLGLLYGAIGLAVEAKNAMCNTFLHQMSEKGGHVVIEGSKPDSIYILGNETRNIYQKKFEKCDIKAIGTGTLEETCTNTYQQLPESRIWRKISDIELRNDGIRNYAEASIKERMGKDVGEKPKRLEQSAPGLLAMGLFGRLRRLKSKDRRSENGFNKTSEQFHHLVKENQDLGLFGRLRRLKSKDRRSENGFNKTSEQFHHLVKENEDLRLELKKMQMDIFDLKKNFKLQEKKIENQLNNFKEDSKIQHEKNNKDLDNRFLKIEKPITNLIDYVQQKPEENRNLFKFTINLAPNDYNIYFHPFSNDDPFSNDNPFENDIELSPKLS